MLKMSAISTYAYFESCMPLATGFVGLQ